MLLGRVLRTVTRSSSLPQWWTDLSRAVGWQGPPRAPPRPRKIRLARNTSTSNRTAPTSTCSSTAQPSTADSNSNSDSNASAFSSNTYVDSYTWLARDSPETRAYIREENRFTQATLAGTAAFQRQLVEEMRSRRRPTAEPISGDQTALPVSLLGGYCYGCYTREDGSRVDYRYRHTAGPAQGSAPCTADIEVIVDTRSIDAYYRRHVHHVSPLKVSPDSRFVGFMVDADGTEDPDLHIVDTKTEASSSNRVRRLTSKLRERLQSLGKSFGTNSTDSERANVAFEPSMLEDASFDSAHQPLLVLPHVCNIEWDGKSSSFLFTRADELRRPSLLYRQPMDPVLQGCSGDIHPELMLQELDDRYFLDIAKTKDGEFITVNLNAKLDSEVYVLPADKPDAALTLVHPRGDFTYFIEHRGDQFYIFTNADGATNFKVVSCPDDTPTKPNWQHFVPTSHDRKIEDAEVFRDQCVIYFRDSQGLPGLQAVSYDDPSNPVTASIPEEHRVCSIVPHANPDFDGSQLLFSMSSPLSPNIDWSFDFKAGVLRKLREQPIKGSPTFFSSNYVCERMLFLSNDGTEVPVTVVRKKNSKLNGRNPLLSIVYGAYGENLEPVYSEAHVAMLQRGWIIAYCHVRGGGELGHGWHKAAKLTQKHKSFEDFEACVTGLCSAGYSSPERTCAQGTSAGGLVVAASCNRRPDIFKAAVLRVPFVDVLTAMTDTSLPLTVHEWDEWGNPLQNPVVAEYMQGYCPYANLRPQHYPDLLVTGCLHDSRVQYWQPLKYVAKLREMQRQASTPKQREPAKLSRLPQGKAGKLRRSSLTLLHTDLDGGHLSLTFDDQARCIAFLHLSLGLPLH